MSEIDRREFMLLGAATAAVLSQPALAGSKQMLKRTVPSTGVELGIIGYGNAAIFTDENDPQVARQTTRALFDLLRDAGGNFADLYVNSVRNVGQWLDRGTLDGLMVATGHAPMGAPLSEQELAALPSLLQRRRLDFLEVRNNLTDMQSTERYWPTLREAKASGLARHIGMTVPTARNHDALVEFMRKERPDFVQVNYSLLEPEAEERVLPTARDLGIAVVTNRPFLNGEYFKRVEGKDLPSWAAEFDCASWGQFGLKYIVSHPAVTCAVTETSKPKHARDNLAAGIGRLPDAAMRQRMRGFVAAL